MQNATMTPEQTAALVDLIDDGAGVSDEPLPEWMTEELPTGDFEPIAARVELERHLYAEALIVGTDNRGPCATVQAIFGKGLPPVTLPAAAVLN